ncbi:hypothetical protein F5890DRAFT_1490280 [Lentinula detonsa]|uniref:BTB domain-containing protein n=1 Tax=Lentinula detonsa TaxID=2804962 RepID=A0AA38Q6Z8_9AGAR|nr:hypothetical protein F5890DRAFT_1490280 [Lentinula detonsa]
MAEKVNYKSSTFDILPCEAGCTQKTDLVLESQDGVQFGAHSANLAAFSDAFPVVDSGINANEVVQMTERADVVLLLLQLTHRQRWMRSDKIPFGLLHRLAEAAEKFFIPAIMEMCRIQMETVASKHPLEVFIYACKHSYDDIRDAAAPGTLDLPFESTLRRLSAYPSTCISWISYRHRYVEASVQFYSRDPNIEHSECFYWKIFWRRSVLSLIAKPLSEKLFIQLWRDEFPCSLKYCRHCTGMLPVIRHWIRTELAKLDMPSFAEVVNAT